MASLVSDGVFPLFLFAAHIALGALARRLWTVWIPMVAGLLAGLGTYDEDALAVLGAIFAAVAGVVVTALGIVVGSLIRDRDRADRPSARTYAALPALALSVSATSVATVGSYPLAATLGVLGAGFAVAALRQAGRNGSRIGGAAMALVVGACATVAPLV